MLQGSWESLAKKVNKQAACPASFQHSLLPCILVTETFKARLNVVAQLLAHPRTTSPKGKIRLKVFQNFRHK